MECFVHEGEAAVGICKNCSRGVCRECAVDNGDGVACKGRCETQVAALANLVSTNVNVTKKSKGAVVALFLVFLLLGFVSLGIAIFAYRHEDWAGVVVCAMAAPIMFVMAYAQYQWLISQVKPQTEKPDSV